MKRQKRRRLRRWAKGILLLFACLILYRGGIFLKDKAESIFFAEQIDRIFFTEQAGNTETAEYPDFVGSKNQIIYYNQEDPRWGEDTYGPVDKIKDAGCGPTVLAMAVSSFTENQMNPKEMCDWAYLNGYCSVGSGSYHTLIGQGLGYFGIKTTVTNNRREVEAALENGKPVIALMGEGHFTSGGHFILLCEIDDDGKVTVADPKSAERTAQKWNFDIITEEAKMSPVSGGAFWILEV